MYIMTADGWKPIEVRSIPAPCDKGLLELSGINPSVKPGQIADKFCAAIDEYLNFTATSGGYGRSGAERTMHRKKEEAIRGIV